MASEGFTRDHRKLVCLHEAGHAVIHAIGGANVYSVSVAPEGDDGSWIPRFRKGRPTSGSLGVCEISEPHLPPEALKWDEDKKEFVCRRDAYAHDLQSYSASRTPAEYQSFVAEQHRQLRSHICAWLAGSLVEYIHRGYRTDWQSVEERYYENFEPEPGDDIILAKACASLLSDGPECEHACELTAATLRRPENWHAVVRLAKKLERVGEIDEFHGLLPPRESGWPPPPPWIQDKIQ